MLKRTFAVLCALLVASVAFAQAYRWVDEDGVVHFSDRPVPGAERIELPQSEQRRTPRSNARTPTQRISAAQPAAVEEPFSYNSIAVAAPVSEETLWNIAGNLNVSIDLQPALQPGHQLRVYFDGEPRTTVTSTSFQLDEVWRGMHNLQVEVLDQSGNMMIRSQPTRFYVQQTSVRN